MPEQVRMIVTHVTDDGSSAFEERFVDEVTEYDPDGNPTFKGNLLWGTTDGIGTVGSGDHADAVLAPFFPGPGGHRFVVFSFLPENGASAGDTDEAPVASEAGEQMPGLMEAFDPERPGMHITDTVDYVYIISGKVTLELDHGEVDLQAGDTIVQRGTWHAWRNRTDTPCVVAAVLVGAERKDNA